MMSPLQAVRSLRPAQSVCARGVFMTCPSVFSSFSFIEAEHTAIVGTIMESVVMNLSDLNPHLLSKSYYSCLIFIWQDIFIMCYCDWLRCTKDMSPVWLLLEGICKGIDVNFNKYTEGKRCAPSS